VDSLKKNRQPPWSFPYLDPADGTICGGELPKNPNMFFGDKSATLQIGRESSDFFGWECFTCEK